MDGEPKVTGSATYAYEYKEPDGIAYGFLVPATIAKGRIATLDTAVAEKMPGRGRGSHLPERPEAGQGKPAGLPGTGRRQDQALRSGRSPCVVAETFEQARAAAYAVDVGYAPDAVNVVLADNVDRAIKPKDRGTSSPDTSSGDAAAAFASAPVKVEVEYTTPLQSHAMMEPHATLAYWRRGQLILFTANQMLNRGQAILASVLDMPKDNIRFVSRYVGGGFGAKLTPHPDAVLAALASKVTNRPVKLALTRQQVFHSTFHRSDTIQRIQLGATPDGKLVSVVHRSWSGNTPGEDNYEAAAEVTRSLYGTPNIATEQPAGRARRSGRLLDAGAGRGGRHAGHRMRHGRTGREARHGPDRPARRQRRDRRSDEARAILHPRHGALPAQGRRTVRLGTSGRLRRGPCGTATGWSAWVVAAASRGNPLQPAKAWVRHRSGRRGHHPLGHDRHRDGDLHDPDPRSPQNCSGSLPTGFVRNSAIRTSRCPRGSGRILRGGAARVRRSTTPA